MNTVSETNDITSGVTNTETMISDNSHIALENKILNKDKEEEVVFQVAQNGDLSNTADVEDNASKTYVLCEDNIAADAIAAVDASEILDSNNTSVLTDDRIHEEINSIQDSLEKNLDDDDKGKKLTSTVTPATEEDQQNSKIDNDKENDFNKDVDEEVALLKEDSVVLESSLANQTYSFNAFNNTEPKDDYDKNNISPRPQSLPDNSAKKFETVFPAPQHVSDNSKVTTKPEVNNVAIPYKFVHGDPNRLFIKFLFANRDGLFVSCDCSPLDTVGDVKGLLLSMWPDELPSCTGGDQIRLICMGKGLLMPDTRTLKDCDVPVFKTHPTPVNVSLKPAPMLGSGDALKKSSYSHNAGNNNERQSTDSVRTTCSCIIL